MTDRPYVPRRIDQHAGEIIWRLPQMRRFGALHRAAFELTHSTDREIRAVGFILVDTLSNRKPEDIISDLGLTTYGGPGGIARQKSLKIRDALLRNLRLTTLAWHDLSGRDAAKMMIASFKTYECNAWPRHKISGNMPPAEPALTWFRILQSGERVPRTAQHLAQILEKNSLAL